MCGTGPGLAVDRRSASLPAGAARRVVSELSKGWDGSFGLGRFVSPPESDEIHGLVCAVRRTPSTVEISYGIAPDQRGRGLATAVLDEVARYVLEQTGWATRVEIVIAPANEASLRVAAKAGFVRDGHRRGTMPGTGAVYTASCWPERSPLLRAGRVGDGRRPRV